MWGTNKKRRGTGFRGGFVTAEVNGASIVLFTQTVEAEDNKNAFSLHLWMTDMKHIYDVGQISAKNENVFSSSLLYKRYDTFDDEIPEKNRFLLCI